MPLPPSSPRLRIYRSIPSKGALIKLKWENNSYAVDSAIVALHAAVGDLPDLFPGANTLADVRHCVHASFQNDSYGIPLRLGEFQDVEHVLARIIKQAAITCTAVVEYNSIPPQSDISRRCKVHAPDEFNMHVISGVSCNAKSITEAFHQRCDEFSAIGKCQMKAKTFTTLATCVNAQGEGSARYWLEESAVPEDVRAFRSAQIHVHGEYAARYRVRENAHCSNGVLSAGATAGAK